MIQTVNNLKFMFNETGGKLASELGEPEFSELCEPEFSEKSLSAMLTKAPAQPMVAIASDKNEQNSKASIKGKTKYQTSTTVCENSPEPRTDHIKKDASWKPLIRAFRRYLKKCAIDQVTKKAILSSKLSEQGRLFCKALGVPSKLAAKLIT